MDRPAVPGDEPERKRIELPCEKRVWPTEFDLGMRKFDCECGEVHAVVMDVHPLGRWIPEAVADVLRETIDPADDYDTFQTIHLLGLVLEEFPEKVSTYEGGDEATGGWTVLWVTEFGPWTLHEIIVELVIELMDHAVSHADQPQPETDFAEMIEEFDIESFVRRYREERDFDDEASIAP